jgi:L-lactate dehydrogenase complex protein LldG
MKPARREILEKLKQSKVSVPEKPDFDEPVFHALKNPPIDALKTNLEAVNGNIHIAQNTDELLDRLKDFLKNFAPEKIYCNEIAVRQILNKGKIAYNKNTEIPEDTEVGITGCEFLIAQTGSALLSSAQKGGRQLFIYPAVHVIIAAKKQLVNTLEEAYQAISEKYTGDLPSQLLLITGPSRTADIEKTLTLGAHGPKQLHLFLYEFETDF